MTPTEGAPIGGSHPPPEPARGWFLTTLGSVRLTGPDAAACARVMAQPKRLAVLVYLAARPAGEPVNRDGILGTLWPEFPTDRAQGNLRNALYFLRRALGGEAIGKQGEALVIAPRTLGCDAAALLDRRSGETPEASLSLYRGEFLDAFHVADAPDFERWVDRTRSALRARAGMIAWSLSAAAEAAGEWISATRYARRAAELSVDVEGATQQVIRLLRRAGDGAAALAEYGRLVLRLEEEFSIPPSPETEALVADIRTHRPSRAVPTGGEGFRGRAHSLAILPLRELGPADGAYLATGLTEDLVTALARLRGIRVVSRASVRRFAKSPPTSMRALQEALGADLVLDGSVQVGGERCRIAVQLIDARTDDLLWAETYDRDLVDVFAVQSDVALRIARTLEAELSPREHRQLRRPATASLRAWQLYLKGREVVGRRDPREAARAITLFRRALEEDEGFALAWVGLADALLVRTTTGAGDWTEATRSATRAVHRALECDPDLGEARATLGIIHSFIDWDPAGAEREFRRAVELSPGYATAHQWYGNWLCAFGRAEEGLAELAAAVDLDPLSPPVSEGLGLGLYHAGRVAEAEAQLRQMLERDPDYWRGHVCLAMCRMSAGRPEDAAADLVKAWEAGAYGAAARPAEAREAARRLRRGGENTLEYLVEQVRSRSGESSMLHVVTIVLLMFLGRHDAALAALAAMRREWLPLLAWFAPVFDAVAPDPRFRRVMERAGVMLPRWRGSGGSGGQRGR